MPVEILKGIAICDPAASARRLTLAVLMESRMNFFARAARKKSAPKVMSMIFETKEGFANSRGMLVENTPPGALEVALECAFAPFDSLGSRSGDQGCDSTFLVGATLNLVEGDVEAATAVLTALRGDNPEFARARSCVMIEPLAGGKFHVVLITPNGETQIHVTPGKVRIAFSDGSLQRASQIRAAMPLGLRFYEVTEKK